MLRPSGMAASMGCPSMGFGQRQHKEWAMHGRGNAQGRVTSAHTQQSPAQILPPSQLFGVLVQSCVG